MPFTKSTPLSSPPQIEGERDLTQRSTSLLPIQNPGDSFSKTHIESHLRSPQCSNFYLPLFSSSSCKKRTSPTVVWFLSLLFFFFAMELAKSRLYMCNCFSPTRFSDYSVAGSDYPDAIGAINFNSIPNSSYFSIRCLWSSISISNLSSLKKKRMLCASSSSFGHASMTMASLPLSRFVGTSLRWDPHLTSLMLFYIYDWKIGSFKLFTIIRYDQRRPSSWKMRNPASASAYPLFLNQLNKDSTTPKTYKEVYFSKKKKNDCCSVLVFS